MSAGQHDMSAELMARVPESYQELTDILNGRRPNSTKVTIELPSATIDMFTHDRHMTDWQPLRFAGKIRFHDGMGIELEILVIVREEGTSAAAWVASGPDDPSRPGWVRATDRHLTTALSDLAHAIANLPGPPARPGPRGPVK